MSEAGSGIYGTVFRMQEHKGRAICKVIMLGFLIMIAVISVVSVPTVLPTVPPVTNAPNELGSTTTTSPD